MEYYNETEWGSWFSDYKDLDQGQLQKGLLKFENERKKTKDMWTRKVDTISWAKHIFHNTCYDEELDEFITPKALLKRNTSGRPLSVQVEANDDQHSKAKETLKEYYKRQGVEYQEVKEFYETRKEQLEKEQRLIHREKSKEDVCCPICQAIVTRTNLAKHRRSKKCLSKVAVGLAASAI